MIDVYKRSELRRPKGKTYQLSPTVSAYAEGSPNACLLPSECSCPGCEPGPSTRPQRLQRLAGLIHGIDPGPESSALVGIECKGIPFLAEIWPNLKILEYLRAKSRARGSGSASDLLAIESMASYGMPVGDPVFVSCYWIGRFAEAWGGTVRLIKAPTVRAHLCGLAKAKKSHVRRALLNKYLRTGGGANPEIGTKAKRGPLYGFKSHAWSALAVAVCARETDLGVTLP